MAAHFCRFVWRCGLVLGLTGLGNWSFAPAAHAKVVEIAIGTTTDVGRVAKNIAARQDESSGKVSDLSSGPATPSSTASTSQKADQTGEMPVLIGAAFAGTPPEIPTPPRSENPLDAATMEPSSRLGIPVFSFALAEALAGQSDLLQFYRENHFAPLWTDTTELGAARRAELMRGIALAEVHGFPVSRYKPDDLKAALQAVQSVRDLGHAEAALSRTFLRLSRDLNAGMLVPSQVDPSYKDAPRGGDGLSYLKDFISQSPEGFFTSLLPKSEEYLGLVKVKLRLEGDLSQGGYGEKVPAQMLRPGDQGPAVVALRNRLYAMGYLGVSATQTYDETIVEAVKNFQLAQGLAADGVAGPGTLGELNRSISERLKSVMVAMERERWSGRDREPRHIYVNLTEFMVRLIDEDQTIFETRAVIGKNEDGRQSPEFSDVMEFMVVNPTWHVPRSIVVKEYLPRLKQNRNAASHLDLYNSQGRKVNRGAVNFAAYSSRNFPFAMKQGPSPRNALGRVKFMFPNHYNIYLHDTPAKDLFANSKRDFSHGCIRLQKPFELAYALLGFQDSDPQSTFQKWLKTGKETRLNLKDPIPVYLVYRTAFVTPSGGVAFRNDVYGRDARIWEALERAGVKIAAVEG